MAIHLASKPAADVVLYTWEPHPTESLSTFTLTATGAAIDAESGSDTLVEFYLSGGTAGQTASVAASAVLADGSEVSETLYIPIIANTAQIAATARDYVNFALRRITRSPAARELEDALERLSGLIARWREGGADIGAPFPLTASSVIYCPDWAVSALRYNLLIECAPLYGPSAEPSAMEYENARRGLQLVKHKNLPDVREGWYY